MQHDESPTFVDSASVTTAMMGLLRGSATEWSRWESETYVRTTSILFRKRASIPAFKQAGDARGPYAYCTTLPHATMPVIALRARQKLWREARSWLAGEAKSVADTLKKLERRNDYTTWVRMNAENFVESHLASHEGMFEEEAIPAIAEVIAHREHSKPAPGDLTEIKKDLGDLFHSHARKAGLDRAQTTKALLLSKGTQGVLMRRAYSASLIARGQHHAASAARSSYKLAMHPLRELALLDGAPPSHDRTKMHVEQPTGCERLVAAFILGNAMRARRAEDRVRQWSEAVHLIRQACTRGARFDDYEVADTLAWRSASAFVTAAKVPMTSAAFRKAADLGWSIVSSVIGSMVVWPWGLIAWDFPRALVGDQSPTERLLRSPVIRDYQFKALAKAAPGAVRQLAIGDE